jgi:hypothetical protein
MQSGFHALHNAARRAAEQVSQRIEHGILEDVQRVELGLRLAEFESELNAAMTMILQTPLDD